MHQCAIDLIWLHAPVLKNKYRPFGIDFPRRAKRRFDKSETASQEDSFGDAFGKSLPFQMDSPTVFRLSQRAQEACRVVALRRTGAAIEVGRNHGAVEWPPAK